MQRDNIVAVLSVIVVITGYRLKIQAIDFARADPQIFLRIHKRTIDIGLYREVVSFRRRFFVGNGAVRGLDYLILIGFRAILTSAPLCAFAPAAWTGAPGISTGAFGCQFDRQVLPTDGINPIRRIQLTVILVVGAGGKPILIRLPQHIVKSIWRINFLFVHLLAIDNHGQNAFKVITRRIPFQPGKGSVVGSGTLVDNRHIIRGFKAFQLNTRRYIIVISI